MLERLAIDINDDIIIGPHVNNKDIDCDKDVDSECGDSRGGFKHQY